MTLEEQSLFSLLTACCSSVNGAALARARDAEATLWAMLESDEVQGRFDAVASLRLRYTCNA